MSDLKTREERIPARQFEPIPLVPTVGLDLRKRLPHSGYRDLADKDAFSLHFRPGTIATIKGTWVSG